MGYLRRTRGFTLIEALVAIAVFAMLGLMTTTMMIGTLQGAKKAAAVALVKNEGGRAMSVISQMLRYAVDVTACASNSVTFIPRQGDLPSTLACVPLDRVELDNVGLTSSKVKVYPCEIACKKANGDPIGVVSDTRRVDVDMTIEKVGAAFASEKASTVFKTQIGLRNRE